MFSVVYLVLLICQLHLVQATIYVTSPSKATTCSGGKPCTVQWLDNGETPLLSDIGACHVGLYNGQQVLVQQLDPVDVGATHSFVFTPDPKAGPSSGTYYVNFTSTKPVGTAAQTYNQFSTFFKLDNMAGSLQSPIASDTSTRPVPSSIANGAPNSIATTILVSASRTVPLSVQPTDPVSSHAASSSPSLSRTLSLSFSGLSSSPSVPPSSGASIPGSASTPSSSGSATFSNSSTTPTSTSLSHTLSTTPSVTPTPSSTSGGSTLTVPPSSSGFQSSRISSPALSSPTLPVPSNVSSAGFLDSKPSRHILAVVFSLSVSILVGGCTLL